MGAREAWLCWSCGDCSDACPRQARPSEYMEAVRRYTIAGMDLTGISRLMYRSGAFALLFATALAVLFTGLLLSGSETPAGGSLDLFGFIPFHLIHDLGVAVLAVMGLAAAVSTVRLIRHLATTLGPSSGGVEAPRPSGSLSQRAIGAVGDVIAEMAMQKRFRGCEVGSEKPLHLRPWFVHYCIMWGFIGLALATAIDFLFKAPGSMVPLWYPPRLLGTVAGLALMYGASVTIVRKLGENEGTGARMLASDWVFLGLLFVVGLTGFVLEAMVYAPPTGSLGYGVFLAHVALAMELLVLFPFTRFAHALYRPLAYGIYRFRTVPRSGQSMAGAGAGE